MGRPWRLSRPSICRSRVEPIHPQWIISRDVDMTAGPSIWRATDFPPRTATTTRRYPRARMIATRPPCTSRNCAANVRFLVYGISSGALRAAIFAERHPEMVARLALDAMVWTGEGSPTLEQRRKKLAEFKATNRRPIDKEFIRSVFDRDHPDTAERHV